MVTGQFASWPPTSIATAPDGLPSAQLTTVSLNGLTAWAAIKELALRSGQTLVIAGAAGAVGGFALELAAARGIRVIAAVSESAAGGAARHPGSGARTAAPPGTDVGLPTRPTYPRPY
jgi:NADPH:quinone reductase